MACRYTEGKGADGSSFPLHVLDELMENINGWTEIVIWCGSQIMGTT